MLIYWLTESNYGCSRVPQSGVIHKALGPTSSHAPRENSLLPSYHQLPRAPQLGLESVGAENAGHCPRLSAGWSSFETNWCTQHLSTQEEVA